MKRIVPILFLFIKTSTISAQINWGDYSHSFREGDRISIVVAMRSDNNSFWDWDGNSALFDLAKKDSAFLPSNSGTLIRRTTFDSSKVHFFVKGIDSSNAHQYEFRVIEYPSKHELIPWESIDLFSTETVSRQSGLPPMAYLGGYKTNLNSMIVVQIKERRNQSAISSAMVAWKSIQPRIGGIYTDENFGVFLKRLQYPWAVRNSGQQINLNTPLPAGDNNLIVFLNANIYHKEQVQYKLARAGQTQIEWRDNDFDNSFVWLKHDSPGKYVLSIRYTAQPDNITSLEFEIAPSWYQTLTFRIAMTVFCLAILGGIVLLVLYFRQRNQNQRTLIHRNKLQLELRGIYAQWNPHFVFNALGSIQGLINKNNLHGANQYLSAFARLMRESLARGERESVSIIEELQNLETYVKLEQLRFGFQFKVDVDDGIDLYATDIPSQLLQPLVENAIKHGVSTYLATGSIHIQFKRQRDTLLILIKDNGRGFNANESFIGFGLKMTRDRINLLSQMSPSQPITMDIKSDLNSGTSVTLTFNHWFL